MLVRKTRAFRKVIKKESTLVSGLAIEGEVERLFYREPRRVLVQLTNVTEGVLDVKLAFVLTVRVKG
jgi:hypothetical protein